MDDYQKIAMEAHAFGVAAALGDLGMDKEAATQIAVGETQKAAAAGALTRLGSGVAARSALGRGAARSAGRRAKEGVNAAATSARGVVGSAVDKARSMGSAVSGKARAAKSKVKDISDKALSAARSNQGATLAGGAALGAAGGAAAHKAYTDRE